jgi:RNA polymerase sigma-70 factor (ECF subfamily)
MGPPRPSSIQRRPRIDEDADLVARAQEGDQSAFEELVRRYADRLHAVISRLITDPQEAEEITQEAFLRAWRAIGSFKGDAAFFTWLYRIGINETRRRARRRSGDSVAYLEDRELEPPDPRPAPDRQVEHADLRAALERAVRALDPEYRAPLVLRDIEGLSTAEAAAVMGISEAAFKSRLHRARLTVREAVQGYLDADEA